MKERSRRDFRKGKIRNISYKHSILGQEKDMHCGMSCKVIEDNGAHNIKVQFKDGTIIEHRTRNEFSKASIVNPNLIAHSLLGKSEKMNCGMMCTVIEDNGYHDITVRFEDGTIREHVRRKSFREKSILNPNLKTKVIRNSIVNVEKKMKCGMQCKVIEDNGVEDITVRFEDGTIVEHRSRRDFKLGRIDNPKRYDTTGMTKTMNNGQRCTVIRDEGSKKITVQFEDGTILENQRRDTFARGNIRNPKLHDLTGMKKIMNNGQECTVIRDEGSKNIVIQFEDGTILERQRRDSFKVGRISNPNYDPTSILGQERRMNCGLLCRVIEDNGSEDITVQFENGIIREKCTRHNFKLGGITAYSTKKDVINNS